MAHEAARYGRDTHLMIEMQRATVGGRGGSRDRAPACIVRQGCARDAGTWFKDTWSRDKDTILLDYANHYNKKSNQRFILVEYHYHLDKNGPG